MVEIFSNTGLCRCKLCRDCKPPLSPIYDVVQLLKLKLEFEPVCSGNILLMGAEFFVHGAQHIWFTRLTSYFLLFETTLYNFCCTRVVLPVCRAHEELQNNTVTCYDFQEFCRCLDKSNIILAPFCGEIPCEEKIKALSARCSRLFVMMSVKQFCITFKFKNFKLETVDHS